MYDPLLYLAFFLVYTIMILIFGKHGFDRSDHVKDFFLANRNLSLFAGVGTFNATWFSAASILGLPGLIYTQGYAVVWSTALAWILGGVFLLYLASKLYVYDIITIPEFFYVHYHSKFLQICTAIILIFSYILYVVIQIRGFGIVVSTMLDISYPLSVLLVYLFVLYTTFGGLHSVARTDLFQFILILLGSLIGSFLIIKEIGSFSFLFQKLFFLEQKGLLTHSYLQIFPNKEISIWIFISAFFSLGIGVAANPQYSIRILAARSKKTAFKMIILSLFFILIIYTAIFFIGIGSRALAPQLPLSNSDEVYPYIIERLLDSPWKGFILISIIAASISTANSQLLIIASSLVYDIYLSIKKEEISQEKILNITRKVIIFFGTISLIISLKPPESLVVFSGYIWGLIASSMFFPLFGGLFTHAKKEKNAIFSMIGGMITYIFGIIFIPDEIKYLLHPVVPGILVSGFLFLYERRSLK